MNPLLLVLLAYLLGAIPTSYWVARGVYGVDLRTEGSGNLGATNTYRVLGWKAALPVVVVDVSKGWLPVWLFPAIDMEAAAWSWALAYGAAAIVGHVFSVWVRFRGGKGVATSAGVFLALAPWGVLVGLLVFALTVAVTRIVSLGSMLAALSLPVAVLVTPVPWPPEARPTLLWFTVALAAFVVWAHRPNLRRILRGEENRIGAVGGGKTEGVGGSGLDAPATPKGGDSGDSGASGGSGDAGAAAERTGPHEEVQP